MKKIKISSFIYLLLVIFLLIDFAGYKFLVYNTKSNHQKDNQILFYQIKNQTSDLLFKLSYSFHTQKDILLEKHRTVYAYMQNHDLNVSLDEIYQKINEGYAGTPYDIYISDENLIIQNTTYPLDKGFDLNFAKEIFERHWEEKTIGISAPIREKKSNNFLSYTDQYLSHNGKEKAAILEVSYTYRNAAKELSAIQELILKHPTVVSAKAYSFDSEGFTYELMLKDDPAYTRTSKEILAAQKEAMRISKKLMDHDIFIHSFMKNGHHYTALYMTAKSPIENDLKLVYTLILEEDAFYRTLQILHLLMMFMGLLGIAAIIIGSKVRSKELKLSEQDQFVKSAMHEIKTPLSIITLNNELRELEYGKDPYSTEIDSALRLLHNSYDSMGFILNKEKLSYPVETLILSDIVKERVQFFQNIAEAHHKSIHALLDGECKIDISRTEIVRLIDNTLSNAIKYSRKESEITVHLSHNRLTIQNEGPVIQDKKKIFQKYYRENNTVGGYGLGLGIIKDICDKYGIALTVHSDAERGTIFIYDLKCHTDDMS